MKKEVVLKRLSQLLAWSLALLVAVSPALVLAQGTGQAIGQKVGPGAPSELELLERYLIQGQGGGGSPQQPGPGAPGRGVALGGIGKTGVVFQVHVLGEVKKPGTYRIEPSTRVDETLQLAGGTEQLGSQRRIEIRRQGRPTIIVDLVDFKNNGNLASNPYLQDNDVIFVPYADRLVRVVGAVRRHGVLELNHEQTLFDVIQSAGGMTGDVVRSSPITVVRFDQEGDKEKNEVANETVAMKSFQIIGGDLIYLPNVVSHGKEYDFDMEDVPGGKTFYPSSKDAVFVIGNVTAAGAYPFNPFRRLDEYVLYAGPTTAANLKGLKVMTSQGKKLSGKKQLANYEVSPGDVIVVPQKIITTDKALMWYNTFANTVITGFTLRQLARSW